MNKVKTLRRLHIFPRTGEPYKHRLGIIDMTCEPYKHRLAIIDMTCEHYKHRLVIIDMTCSIKNLNSLIHSCWASDCFVVQCEPRNYVV